MSKYKYTIEELSNAIKNSLSIAETCRKLNIRPCGGNYKTLNYLIKENNIDISHFTGKAWNVGIRYRIIKPKIELSEILVENSSFRSSNGLRKRLISEGYKEYKCECCGNTKWMGNPIKLELHHINGINTDNRIENLQILCPNCHSMTDTFRKGKSYLSDKRKEEYDNFKN